MTDYRLDIAGLGTDGLGGVIIQDALSLIGVPEGSKLMFYNELRGHGKLEFSLPIDHPLVTVDNFAEGRREVHLYRNDVLVFGGRIWASDVAGWSVRFTCYGWSFDLTKRERTTDYAQVKDQLAIVRDLINDTQAEYPLGLSHYDNSLSGVNRQVVICAEERLKIWDIIEDLASAEDGFDVAVLPDKRLRLWGNPANNYRRGTATNVAFDGTENLSSLALIRDATQIATQVAIIGPASSSECSIPDVYVREDATSKSVYGLLQESDSSDIVDAVLREKIADEWLRNARGPILQPRLSIETSLQDATANGVAWEDYDVGDTVTIETSRGTPGGFGYLNQAFRIISKGATVDANGVETVDLELDSAVTDL
jgi:hypothetical protein